MSSSPERSANPQDGHQAPASPHDRLTCPQHPECALQQLERMSQTAQARCSRARADWLLALAEQRWDGAARAAAAAEAALRTLTSLAQRREQSFPTACQVEAHHDCLRTAQCALAAAALDIQVSASMALWRQQMMPIDRLPNTVEAEAFQESTRHLDALPADVRRTHLLYQLEALANQSVTR